jgi:hypothetical protein
MKLHSFGLLFGIFLVSAIVLGSFSVCPAAETTVEKIMNNRDSYDGQDVSVMGTVSNLKFKAFEVENDYTTFMLASKSGGRIKVFAWGKLKLKAGQKVQVTGVYRKVWTTARRHFYNQIVASDVK